MLLNAADTDLKRNGFSASRFPQYFIAFTKEATRKHKWYKDYITAEKSRSVVQGLMLAKDIPLLPVQWAKDTSTFLLLQST